MDLTGNLFFFPPSSVWPIELGMAPRRVRTQKWVAKNKKTPRLTIWKDCNWVVVSIDKRRKIQWKAWNTSGGWENPLMWVVITSIWRDWICLEFLYLSLFRISVSVTLGPHQPSRSYILLLIGWNPTWKPVEVNSLSHYLQGFRNIQTVGWEWDFSHQQ